MILFTFSYQKSSQKETLRVALEQRFVVIDGSGLW